MWEFGGFPIIDIPEPRPTFSATTDCPDPSLWIVSALVVGLVVGYLYAKG